MRQIFVFAIAVLLIGVFAARFADQTVTRPNVQAAALQSADPPGDSVGGQTLTLDPDRLGHFKVDARIEGRHIDFMVDTGASLVIMRESDAAQIGIHPMRGDYTRAVSTANGTIKAAPARIERIEVGAIAVYDVQALVLPDDALWQNLLGVSFLSRLKRYEYTNGHMVLEQ
jgi:aspartyl protease family protein